MAMDLNSMIGEAKCAVEVRVNTKERMLHKKKKLEQELKDTEEILALLEKNPDIERLLTLMGRNY